jgi:hypothetical protein
MSGRTQPLGWTDKEVKMNKGNSNFWHNAKGTIREVSATLSSIADGVMLEPASRDHHAAALLLKHRAWNARTHKDLAMAAVTAAFQFKQVGDLDAENAIVAVMAAR